MRGESCPDHGRTLLLLRTIAAVDKAFVSVAESLAIAAATEAADTRRAADELATAAASLQQEGLTVMSMLRLRQPARAISKAANSSHVALMMLAAHDLAEPGGQTAEREFRSCWCRQSARMPCPSTARARTPGPTGRLATGGASSGFPGHPGRIATSQACSWCRSSQAATTRRSPQRAVICCALQFGCGRVSRR
jgi:hypothetical protein